MSYPKVLTKISEKDLPLYELAIRKYQDTYINFDLYLEKDSEEGVYKLIASKEKDRTDFFNIYRDLSTQAKLIEIVLKRNGLIKEM